MNNFNAIKFNNKIVDYKLKLREFIVFFFVLFKITTKAVNWQQMINIYDAAADFIFEIQEVQQKTWQL